MGIAFDFLAKAAENLTAETKASLADRGTLDHDQVLVELCAQEDDRVRPTHAALDGTVWAPGDPDAPIPPLDYGCRCYIKYRAKPGTSAAAVLPTTDLTAIRVGSAYAKFLDKELDGWRPFLKELHDRHLAKLDQMGEAVLFVEEKKPGMTTQDQREFARMLMQADKNA